MQKRRQQIPDTWRALRASESTQFRTSISSIKKEGGKEREKGFHTPAAGYRSWGIFVWYQLNGTHL